MAQITRRGDSLIVTLTAEEKRWALRSEVEVPISSVLAIETVIDPIQEIHGMSPRGFKMIGIYLPGRTAVGTFFAGFRHKKTFAAIDRDTPKAVRIRLDPKAEFGQLIIGCDDPDIVGHLIKGETHQ